MKNFLSDLLMNRDDIQRLECQRSLLSKEISLVRELEALGSAMSSHPLNTLSQRYGVYKKKRNDVDMIKNILMEKAAESERMMEDYVGFTDNACSGCIVDIEEEVTMESEFDLVKEFQKSKWSKFSQPKRNSLGSRKNIPIDNNEHAFRHVVCTCLRPIINGFANDWAQTRLFLDSFTLRIAFDERILSTLKQQKKLWFRSQPLRFV